ncbi:MAG TPA: LysM peptidoglycan-binding domain-containing protein [Acidothermaceae bacterium]
MSPQPTLTSPLRSADFVRDLAPFEHPGLRRLSAIPGAAVPAPEAFDTLVISPRPLVERTVPLRLVDLSAPLRAERLRTSETLTPGHIRLTRRGRLALLGVAMLCMLFGFSIGNLVSFGSSAPSYPTTPSAGSPTIVVQPGQTLWAIATQVAPHADPRATVQRIIDLNHLGGTTLQVGESLALPS